MQKSGLTHMSGDTATISGSCGSSIKNVCQEFKGVDKTEGVESSKLTTKNACLGAQGKLKTLPAC